MSRMVLHRRPFATVAVLPVAVWHATPESFDGGIVVAMTPQRNFRCQPDSISCIQVVSFRFT